MKCCECFVCGQAEPTEPTRGLTVLWNCPDSDVCFSTVGSSHATPVHSGATGHLSLWSCLMSPARESPAGQIDMTHLAFYTGGRALGSSVRNSSTGMSWGMHGTGFLSQPQLTNYMEMERQDDAQDPAQACVGPPFTLSLWCWVPFPSPLLTLWPRETV